MAVIRKLSPEIIGQIAAGEVVERPASAVKELVENSIDAGAKNVTVELREGGIKYLRVSDNGQGIPAEQIRLAFERHATSKITYAKDLYDIHTLGFRGEALASIAAVSRVTLTTRTQTADFGTKAVVEAGEFVDIRQAASPVGTTIVVEDLFVNAPVRLKFLKKPSMEAAMVSDYMLRLILSRPDIAFRFVSQGKTIYHSAGDGSPESALFCLYGREALRQMQKVAGHMNGVLLSGYVGAGELARGNRQQQSFFVNGRYFRSAVLSRALESGCEGRVMIGRFPMCAIFLELPTQQVDVNVHPNKLEVRFQNEQAVAQAVETLVKEAFSKERLGERLTAAETSKAEDAGLPKPVIEVVPLKNDLFNPPIEESIVVTPPDHAPQPSVAPQAVDPTSEARAQRPQTAEKKDATTLTPAEQEALRSLRPIEIPVASTVAMRLAQSSTPARPVYVPPAQVMSSIPVELRSISKIAGTPVPQPKQETLREEQTVFAEVEKVKPLRMVGIVFDTYWIFESGERLLLVDQHAAHERILYDRLMARFESGHISQRLLSPQIVRLTANDMALMAEAVPMLSEAGFEVEPFDDTCVAVQAIPTLFGENEPPRELLLEALDEWQAGRGQVTRERIRKRVAQMACKRAIKGGDKLNGEQIEGFMREMLKSDAMPTCPHGRPIVTEITRYALEKRFKRIQ